ncbi:putative membrane protein [Natronobacillus azotifigens]|uniref:DUF4395 domain-containing protein n=1 Tax=Natronobacillus azotifigens TaxID=472978 RepID=A0A9J6R8W9_9BACI|nr:DUF4395 domain-containing protein [Natronobacillus azotifigens]MCZ0701729.1 DUF4395 domain-containing protein [Natronobacillus azotifigens]
MIPKPLVQVNQWFLVLSTAIALIFFNYLLFIPFIVGVVTLTTKRNPVIAFAARFLKKTNKSYPQEDKNQQLFNQAIATTCLAISIIAFYFELTFIGYLFSVMVILAAGIALMGYCIGCTIRYRYMMWKYRRQNQNT